MFGKLKEKLKGWFKKSKEKIEEEAEVVETKEEVKETKGPEEEKPEPKKEKETKEPEIKIPTPKDKEFIKQPEMPKPSKEPEETAEVSGKEPVIEKVLEQPKTEVGPVEAIPESMEDITEESEEEPEEPTQETTEVLGTEELTKGKLKPEETVGVLGKDKKPKKSFFSKLKSKFSYKISKEEFNEIFNDLEMLLLENNVALEVVEDLQKNLEEKLIGREIPKANLEEEIKNELKNSLNEILIEPDNPLDIIKLAEKPFVILFFGINGTGKTTSIAKIAHFLKKSGFSVVLAAGDTFRAASIEQLSKHAEKLNTPIIKQDYGSDPAAVGFDAIKYAKKNHIDVVLIDTAGRMHTKQNLLSEMEKISRVCNPDLKLFVAESIAGNDAVEQARTFHQAIEIDGSILSKVDVDEKGGTIISVSHATNKPIFYLGIGQNYEDLELFNKQHFIENLGL
jgi:fused signal recognition particle receptor